MTTNDSTTNLTSENPDVNQVIAELGKLCNAMNSCMMNFIALHTEEELIRLAYRACKKDLGYMSTFLLEQIQRRKSN